MQLRFVKDRTVAMLGFVGWYWKRFQGAVDGINIGIAYAIVNNKVISSYLLIRFTDAVPYTYKKKNLVSTRLRLVFLVPKP